jgi:RecA-family ATPase
MLANLALSITTGEPFLGTYEVKKTGPVIFIQQEDNNSILARRFTTIQNLLPPKKHGNVITFEVPRTNGNLHIHPYRELHFSNPEVVAGLGELIEEVRPLLVIGDPLYSMVSMKDYMNEAAQHLMILKQWRDKYKTSFLLAHHTTKHQTEDRSRDNAWGGQFMNAWLETGWQLRPRSGEGKIRVERHTKQSASFTPLNIDFDVQEWMFDATITPVGSGTKTLSQKVADCINEGGMKSYADILAKVGLKSNEQLQRIMKALKAEKVDGEWKMPK